MQAPDLIPFSNGTDWPEYEDAIYQIYLDTVAHANLTFRGDPIKVRFRPLTKKKGFGFWHLISEAPDQRNRNEEDRIPDLRRCERIRWIAWCIRNADTGVFSWWENERRGETHVVIWTEAYDYAVILGKRRTRDGLRFYLLKTAYCLRGHTIRKFRKERDAWNARR